MALISNKKTYQSKNPTEKVNIIYTKGNRSLIRKVRRLKDKSSKIN